MGAKRMKVKRSARRDPLVKVVFPEDFAKTMSRIFAGEDDIFGSYSTEPLNRFVVPVPWGGRVLFRVGGGSRAIVQLTKEKRAKTKELMKKAEIGIKKKKINQKMVVGLDR